MSHFSVVLGSSLPHKWRSLDFLWHMFQQLDVLAKDIEHDSWCMEVDLLERCSQNTQDTTGRSLRLPTEQCPELCDWGALVDNDVIMAANISTQWVPERFSCSAIRTAMALAFSARLSEMRARSIVFERILLRWIFSWTGKLLVLAITRYNDWNLKVKVDEFLKSWCLLESASA